MTTNLSPSRPLAVLSLTRLSVPEQLQVAQTVLTAMTGNASFPTPTPPLTALTSAIAAVAAAETTALTRVHGAVPLRNEMLLTLVSVLDQLRMYVQGVADAGGPAAAALIESAGMSLRKKPVHPLRGFSLRQGAVSGTLLIRAPAAARRASYEWQYSASGGTTWITMPPTLQSRTSLTGLTPQTSIEVKYRAVTKTGADDWSAPISFIVA